MPKVPRQSTLDLPSDLSAPAYVALTDANITTLKKLSKYAVADILNMHGIGPSTIPKLRRALEEKGLSFRE